MGDYFDLELSLDGGAWTPLVSIGDVTTLMVWTEATYTVIPAGSNVQLRICASDRNNGADLIKAGIDDILICPSGPALPTDYPTHMVFCFCISCVLFYWQKVYIISVSHTHTPTHLSFMHEPHKSLFSLPHTAIKYTNNSSSSNTISHDAGPSSDIVTHCTGSDAISNHTGSYHVRSSHHSSHYTSVQLWCLHWWWLLQEKQSMHVV